ncbi:hypothetical protein EVC12_061 [Rhizobium phage RHph_I42]|nr:hypothetical protein EVC12_061 [Rhizobium phage RHph_I42]
MTIYLKAKSVKQVEDWVSTVPHHEARAITVNGKDGEPPIAVGIELIADNQRIRIPSEIWSQACVTPYGAPDGFMFHVDALAVAVRHLLGKYVTSTATTYQKVKDKFTHEPGGLERCGVRQAVYVGVEYLHKNGDNLPAVPYYKIVGRLGTYYQVPVLGDHSSMRLIESGLYAHDEEFRLKVCKEHGIAP